MTSQGETLQSTCTRTCQVSELTLQRITTAVLERLAVTQTAMEEHVDAIDGSILDQLTTRIGEVEAQLDQVNQTVQDRLIERYGPIMGQLQSLEDTIGEDSPTESLSLMESNIGGDYVPNEQDRQLAGGQSESSIPTPDAIPSQSPIPQIDTDRPRIPTTTPSPSLRPDPYRPIPDCPQYDWCEPLRIWITQLVSQFQSANLSATSNPQMRYYERQNQQQEQEEEQEQRESNVDDIMQLTAGDPPVLDYVDPPTEEI